MSSPSASSIAPAPSLRQRWAARFPCWTLLVVVNLLGVVAAAGWGAFEIAPGQVISGMLEPLGLDLWATPDARTLAVLWSIRLPRVVLSLFVGVGLAVAGVVMQALFRNPLASPQIIGVSNGAALGASAAIVSGGAVGELGAVVLVPLCAFVGGLAAAVLVLRLGRSAHGDGTAGLLLAGVATNAIAGAAMGLLIYVADDAQLRSLTFWTLGSLAGARWSVVAIAGVASALVLGWSVGVASKLDLLQLGEDEAALLGVDVARLELWSIIICAAAVGALVSFTGVIGFVGLVVPHMARLAVGPVHRVLVPAAALLGGGTLLWADLACRTVVAPGELPIGILTTLLAAPFFLWLLRRAGRGGIA